MKLRVETIPDSGLNLRKVLGAEGFKGFSRDDREVYYKFNTPISVDLRVTESGRDVFIKGSVTTNLFLRCSRCLGDFDYALNSVFECTFSPSKSEYATDDLELEIDDLGLSFYHGEEIDVSEAVFEQIVLAVPFKPLCHGLCRGLCHRCGKDLNKEKCECANKEILNVGFSKLQDFKVESKKQDMLHKE